MPSVLMPDLTSALVRDHAGSYRVIRRARLAEERAAVGRRGAGHDVAANAALGECRGGVLPEALDIDGGGAAGVGVGELVAQPEVPVGNVGDAAPVASHGAKDSPELGLGVAIALSRHA